MGSSERKALNAQAGGSEHIISSEEHEAFASVRTAAAVVLLLVQNEKVFVLMNIIACNREREYCRSLCG
jgi:hypothetical protein